MAKICPRGQDGLGLLVEWALSIVATIYTGKGDIRNCRCYREMKLFGAWNECGGKGVRRKA